MNHLDEQKVAWLVSRFGEQQVLTENSAVRKKSHDFFWFSPRLEKMLSQCQAEAVVSVAGEQDLLELARFCAEHRVPIVPRGAGTGNFGQSVPLRGGVLVDFTGMDRILDIDAQTACVEPGVRCQRLEEAAREQGAEMLCYPSTWLKATIGGFACGGSGGVGGMSHGLLKHNRMIEAATVITVEESPQRMFIEGGDSDLLLHSFGAIALVSELRVRLTPRRTWRQMVISGKSLEEVFSFALEIGQDESIALRLQTLLQWPLPDYCIPIRKRLHAGHHILLMDVEESCAQPLRERAARAGLQVPLEIEPAEPRKPPFLSDFVQGHSILWAIKHDRRITSCSVFIDREHWREQLEKVQRRFDQSFSVQVDFHRYTEGLTMQSSLMFNYTDDADLDERLEFLEAEGMTRFNVHDPYMETKMDPHRIRERLALKARTDPHGLLNPGHITSLETVGSRG